MSSSSFRLSGTSRKKTVFAPPEPQSAAYHTFNAVPTEPPPEATQAQGANIKGFEGQPVFLRGSFEWDIQSRWFTHRWESLDEFTGWLESEKLENTVELLCRNITKSRSGAFLLKKHYVCARNSKRDKKRASKSAPDSGRKKSTKRTGCQCALTIKTYPNTSEVLGHFQSDHSHELGNANLCFTRLSRDARKQIASYLAMGVEPQTIENMFKQGLYNRTPGSMSEEAIRSRKFHRDSLVTMADILDVKVCPICNLNL